MTQNFHIRPCFVSYFFKCSIISVSLIVYACGSGTGGSKQEVTSPPSNTDSSSSPDNAVPRPATFTVAQDDPLASDDNDGHNQPFASLQHALNQLQPGDTLEIHSSSTPYRANVDSSSTTEFHGFHMQFSGEPNHAITIKGVGSEMPVIDQGIVEINGNSEVVGIFLDCVSHIVIQNIEIRNVSGAGITSSLEGCNTDNIVLENNYIHHVYGQDLTAGIRIMAVSELTIEQNQIHSVMRDSDNSDFDYAVSGIIDSLNAIELTENHIWDVENGVTLRSQGNNPIVDLSINNNLVQESNNGLVIEADEDLAARAQNVSISNNRFILLEQGINLSLQQSIAQSENICIHNNVLSDLNHGINVGGITQLQIFNNIFQKLDGEIVNIIYPEDPAMTNRVSLFNHNLYWDNSDPSWTIGVDQNETFQLFKLADWQAFNNDVIPLAPDETAYVEDPLISAANDYYPGNINLVTGAYDNLSVGADPTLSGYSCF